jgi:MSHA biogenesis protein MshO
VSGNLVTMTDNPFINQPYPGWSSPTRRFQVVSTPVTYYCDGSYDGVAKTATLTRYSGYAIQAAQPVSITAAPLAGALAGRLADRVYDCAFTFDSLPNIPRGLVSVHLKLGQTGSSTGQVSLVQQVHVDNAP